MATETIELRQKWKLGMPLKRGGFGRVFIAHAEDGSDAVIKLVPKDPGASRELLFEPISGLPNIVPILDSGEWQDQYVLVMPRAEKSLRDYLQDVGRLQVQEAVGVLRDVAMALSGLQSEVVHRDLKPDNVLLYRGHWCLADFGIARYAGATTGPDTRKFALTPLYAAPEQWRSDRATPATDVYAFGVMAFELLMGHLPFPGPDVSDFRDQHLHRPTPPMEGVDPSIVSLVTECLYKAPQARPLASSIVRRLGEWQGPSPGAVARLQMANQQVAEGIGERQADLSSDQSAGERRSELLAVASRSLAAIMRKLTARILEAAPLTAVSEGSGLVMRLRDGVLVADLFKTAPPGCLASAQGPVAVDVIAYSAIAAYRRPDRYGYEGRSHSLWFCDVQNEGVYRWFELAFTMVAPSHKPLGFDPFALPPDDEDAAGAFASPGQSHEIAWRPLPFDQGEDTQFLERWIGWFASVVDDSLKRPSMAADSSGTY